MVVDGPPVTKWPSLPGTEGKEPSIEQPAGGAVESSEEAEARIQEYLKAQLVKLKGEVDHMRASANLGPGGSSSSQSGVFPKLAPPTPPPARVPVKPQVGEGSSGSACAPEPTTAQPLAQAAAARHLCSDPVPHPTVCPAPEPLPVSEPLSASEPSERQDDVSGTGPRERGSRWGGGKGAKGAGHMDPCVAGPRDQSGLEGEAQMEQGVGCGR